MSELSVFESAKQDYEKEIYDLKQEIEYLRSVGSLGILDKKCKELQNINEKQKEVLDKIKELIKEKYSNKDGEIWHDGFKEIYKLLEEIE